MKNKRDSGACDKSVVRTSLYIASAAAFLISNSETALSGPCTAQIAQFEQQMASARPTLASGPTATQSVDAQLHHQPTPSTVGQADHTANKDGDAAIEQAKKADSANDAAGCNAALVVARRLYDIKD